MLAAAITNSGLSIVQMTGFEPLPETSAFPRLMEDHLAAWRRPVDPRYVDYKRLRVSIDAAGVALVVLTDPGKLNAIDEV